METIISSLISAGMTLIVCLITSHAQVQKTEALIEYRIGQLEKKVDRHNNLIDRTYKLEQDAAMHDADLKRINHRLDGLEDDHR